MFKTTVIDPSDRETQLIVSSKRDPVDYEFDQMSKNEYLLPGTVLRGLASPDSVKRQLSARETTLKRINKELNNKCNLEPYSIHITRQKLHCNYNKKIWVPMHFSYATEFNDIKIKLNFISNLHNIIDQSRNAVDLSLEKRIKYSEAYLNEYISEYSESDITFINMPKRKFIDFKHEYKQENSITHTLLLRAGDNGWYREYLIGDMEYSVYCLINEISRTKSNVTELLYNKAIDIILQESILANNENFQREATKVKYNEKDAFVLDDQIRNAVEIMVISQQIKESHKDISKHRFPQYNRTFPAQQYR
jgi:hypothetical protein